MLFVSSWLLIRQTGPTQLHAGLDSTGILQLTWLLGQEPAIAERMAEVEEPQANELRAAGTAFEVNFSDSAREGLIRRTTSLNIE